MGCTALHIAARDDRAEIVKLIVAETDIDPNIQDQVSDILHTAGIFPPHNLFQLCILRH